MSSFRFGKHPPKHDYRTLRLKNYLTDALPAPKPAYDALQIVFTKLGAESSAIPALFPMDGNDRLGDRTIAAAAHAITLWDMPEAAVTKLYMHLTGGLDSGLNELEVLNHRRQKPVDGERILAFAAIDVKHTQIRQAIELFGGVYLGFQVQQGCQQEFEARTPWTPGRVRGRGLRHPAARGEDRGLRAGVQVRPARGRPEGSRQRLRRTPRPVRGRKRGGGAARRACDNRA